MSHLNREPKKGTTMTEEEWIDLGVGESEHYLVKAICQNLLTEAQRAEMFRRDTSIEDVLNGRTEGEHSEFVQELFNAWNQTLGWKEFGY